MGLTKKQRQAAFAYGCTHRVKTIDLLVRKADFGYEFGQILNNSVMTWYGTREIDLSQLVPINWVGYDYQRGDIRCAVEQCPIPVLEAMSSEVYAYPETQRAPVTQQPADCWGVTVQQVWEWALPAFSRAVEQGYKAGVYSPSKVVSDV